MNAFSRSKKHISMDRVKKMHEEKYQRQLLAEKKEEKIQNKIQEIVKSEVMDWRSELSKTKVETVLEEVTREVVVEEKIIVLEKLITLLTDCAQGKLSVSDIDSQIDDYY